MIPMNNFKAEPTELKEQMLDAVRRVFESGWYVLGNEVAAFEQHWAAACGTSQAVGVGNGMDAIEISLRGLGIGAGDEVITTSMTAFATVLAIFRTGATPVLADIEPGTALMSKESAERVVSARTRAVVLVHLYGQVRDMDVWQEFCREQNLFLIEDCAQAHLASWRSIMSGNFGEAGAFSFYPTKNLGALGDAGMIVTSDSKLADKARHLRNYGQSAQYLNTELGLNSRLDELQAALLAVRLKWLPEFTMRRREIAGKYRSGIRNELIKHMLEPQDDLAHTYHLYVVICDQREALFSHLDANKVMSQVHYPVPVHKQPPLAGVARDPAGLKYSERHASTCLSLPCHPQMTHDEVDRVIQCANSFRGH